ALELGADDFVAKPFDAAELQARVEAVLRRGASARRADPDGDGGNRRVGALVIEPTRCRALLAGQPLSLTPSEYRLLSALADRLGEVVSREDLARAVWGRYDYGVGR